ncbi:uncharacterized protein PV09_09052 [Verruconis gallopava]|uniref:Heme haloperoxidase family profile domain-containing protein n=1 Tax=Verruconis gallopava TaxID=253628 RepID=A0A0D1ZYX3_9PEZI|nr:uncharacterized protein PV09_09052 [Verruconis gallopava]KIV99284.1 hypothetical protein PV09_09052 [Verruconis gallopava]
MATPEGHPEIDWDNWKPAGPGDVRSPCPAINALANHGILPHDGKNITKAMAVKALTSALHLDATTASVFAWGGVAANPNAEEHNFDLNHVDKHGWIEHDVSLSREDIAFGSNSEFNKERWAEVWKIYKEGALTEGGASGVGPEETNWKSASKARYFRVKQSKERHEAAGKEFGYGIKEVILSYGESALFLNMLGKDGAAPLEWVRILFEEERWPYKEGWRPPKIVDQSMMRHVITKLMEANEDKAEEAVLVGLGTVRALEAAVASLIKVSSPSYCSVM